MSYNNTNITSFQRETIYNIKDQSLVEIMQKSDLYGSIGDTTKSETYADYIKSVLDERYEMKFHDSNNNSYYQLS